MPKDSFENLHDLLILKLKSLYDIEQQLVKALPKMAKAADNEDLRAGFEEHLQETKSQVERLEEALKLLNVKPAKSQVEAIRGLITDAEWVIKNIKNPQARDAALVAAARYVEHYEVAGYTAAISWAETMGHDEVRELLEETLDEEVASDEKLGDLAESEINDAANDVDTDETEKE